MTLKIAVLCGVIAAAFAQTEPAVDWRRVRSTDYESLYCFMVPRLPDNKPPRVVDVWLAPTEIRRVEVVADRLVVLGSIGTTAGAVTAMEINEPTSHSTFLCYTPVLSPTKRFVVYKGFYPRFAERQQSSNVVGVFKNSWAFDQLPGGQLVDRRYPLSNLGVPIYPRANVDAQSFEPALDKSIHETLLGDGMIAWFDDDHGIAFVDRVESQSGDVTVNLVVVQLADDGMTSMAREYQLDEAQAATFRASGLTSLSVDDSGSVAQLVFRDTTTTEIALAEN